MYFMALLRGFRVSVYPARRLIEMVRGIRRLVRGPIFWHNHEEVLARRRDVDPAPAPTVEVIETDRGRISRLPPRQLGRLHWLALLPFGFVVLMSVCLVKLYLIRAAIGLPD